MDMPLKRQQHHYHLMHIVGLYKILKLEKVKEIDDKAKACFITAYEVYYELLRDLFPGFEIDCFMRKPIENEELLRKVLSAK